MSLIVTNAQISGRLNMSFSEYVYQPGLVKTTYAGYFSDNPSFFATAVPTTYGANPATSVQTTTIEEPSSDDGTSFSIQWLGYFVPATTETYTLFTTSDDASYVWIGSNAVSNFTNTNALVNNGGTHAAQERSGTVALTAGVYYPIRIQFGESSGGDECTFRYSSPTITKTSDVAGRVFYNVAFNGIVSYNYETAYGTPTYTITTFPSTGTGVTNNDDLLIAIDANISSTDDGILIDLGGNGGAGVSVGVLNGTLRARAFNTLNDTAFNNDVNAAFVETSILSYTGSLATYYIAVDASAFSLKVYVQPGGRGSDTPIVLLASATAGGGQPAVYGSGVKGYGTVNTNVADLGASYEVNFTGTISQIRYWAESARDVSGFGTL